MSRMDDMWDDSNYNVECWDNDDTGNFIFSCEQERNVTGFEEIDAFGTAFYLPEECSDECREGLQYVGGSISLNGLTQTHGLGNERRDDTLNNENTTTTTNNNNNNNNKNNSSDNNNNSNNNINISKHNNGSLKRKALNNNIVRYTKQKTEHDDKICSVCFVNDTKYKFPCCGELYCSVVCFKKHDKESCLVGTNSYNNLKEEGVKETQPNEAYQFSTDGTGPRHHKRPFSTCENKEELREEEIDVEEYRLTQDQKNKIRNDLTLKWLLKNEHVRSVFREFALAKDKVTYLSQYIGDPTIVQVFDQIMKSMEGGEEGAEEALDSCYS